MKSVYVLTEIYTTEDYDNESIVCICNSKRAALKAANRHITENLKEINDRYDDEAEIEIRAFKTSYTYDELIDFRIKPYVKVKYKNGLREAHDLSLRVSEWAVLK